MNRFSQYQLFQLTLAYFKEIVREPGVLFWGIIFPILMSLGLGIAFTKKADTERNIAVVSVQDEGTAETNSGLSRALSRFGEKNISDEGDFAEYKISIPNEKLGNTIFLLQEMTWDEAMTGLKRGSVNLIITEQDHHILYHFDPANPDAQLSYLKLSYLFDKDTLPLSNTSEYIAPLEVQGTRYIDFLIPGLIAMGIMMSTMWGISYGIIEKRSKKLLRRMVATPMKKSNFLIGMITVRIGMNFIESVLLFLFAWWVFDIQIQGSIPAVIAIFIAGNVAFAGIAIFISSRTAKTEIGNGLINVVVFPMMLLSGIFFSYHNFPESVIPYIQKMPLTMVADGIRSIFIEGAGFAQVSVPLIVLTSIGVVFFTAGLKMFKWY
ncbi:MAG: ABC transporter permease [Bacteroidales bacterium]|nr:ABC transporter permease [Bacteroidales bacterium]